MSSRLTAMDIEKQEFAKKMRGLDPDEVRLYLRSVAEEVERLNLDNGRLLEEVGELKRQVEDHRSREVTLQATLVSAQSMTDELKQRARDEAEMIVRDARLEADRVLRKGQDRIAGLEEKIGQRRIEMEVFQKRLRSVIEEHLILLDQRREDYEELDNVRVMPTRENTEVG